MKKRILCAVTVLTVLVCLFSFATAATADDATPNFQAGYSIKTIDPNNYVNPDTGKTEPITGLPMGGYGGSASRLSVGRVDDTGDGTIDENDGLFATCVAVTDQLGNTILYVSVDVASADQNWSNPARSAIVAAVNEANFDIKYNNIFITAAHNHSAPDLTYSINNATTELGAKCKTYREWVYDQLGACAVEALTDRSEVVMTKGSVDASQALSGDDALDTEAKYNDGDPATRMNYVRHYLVYDASGNFVGVAGSNFGYQSKYNATGYTVVEVSAPNDTMDLVMFTPTDTTKDPIVLANWRAHATMSSTTQTAYGGKNNNTAETNYYNISSDYVSSFRQGLAAANYRTAFIQGAAGNLTPNTAVDKLQDPEVLCTDEMIEAFGWPATWEGSPIPFLYGAKLARVAAYGLSQMADAAPLDASAIRSMSVVFQSTANTLTAEEAALVDAMNAYTGDIPEYNGKTFTSLIDYLTYDNTTWGNRSNYYTDFPYLDSVNSRFELLSLENRRDITDSNAKTGLSAIALGNDLMFMVTACELSDRYYEVPQTAGTYVNDDGTFTEAYFRYYLDNPDANDWSSLVSAETYGTPLVVGYTNGYSGYMPNYLSYDYNTGDESYTRGSYESQRTTFAQRSGEDLMKITFKSLLESVSSEGIIRCECGDLLEGTNAIGHVCSDVYWSEWNNKTTLPASGNYILTEDVTITAQHTVKGDLRLDLNGHNITYAVPAEKATGATRVFYVDEDGYLSITDSSSGTPGTVTRDLSNLTEDQKNAISNYGLIVIIEADAGEGDGFTLYNGILDSDGGRTTGGGSVVANLGVDSGSVFKMYGGTITGGASNYGAVYVEAQAEIYGGNITGNTTLGGDNGSYCGGIYLANKGILKIGGNANISGNTKQFTNNGSNKTANTNIRIKTDSNLENNFTVVGEFTGKASLIVGSSYLTDGNIVGISEDASFTPDNLYMDNGNSYVIGVDGEDLVLHATRYQCECGGTVTSGTHGHTCKDLSWAPWTSDNALPTSGNYYLLSDVTVSAQKSVSGNLRLDLNGHNITRKVNAGSTYTRVFVVNDGDYLSITDSSTVADNTAIPGTISRDLTLMTDDQKSSVTNHGLLVMLGTASDVGCTIYNGIFDSTGAYSGGGSILANLSKKDAMLKIYGGEFKGGISENGSILTYSDAELYGGYIHGGTTETGNGVPGVYVSHYSDTLYGTLTIGGNVRIIDNIRSNDWQTNIRFADAAKMADNFTVTSDFTGEAGIYLRDRQQAQDVGNSSADATFTKENLHLDHWNDYNIKLVGTDLLLDGVYAATITDGETVTSHETLAGAITEYANASADAYITLMKDNDETVTFNRDTVLDLNACDLKGNATVATDFTLQLADSATDDYTTKDGVYGKVMANAVTGNVCGLNSNLPNPGDFYMAYAEGDGSTSYHRVNLQIVGITLRPDSREDGTYHPGVYYNAQFGGDEQVKEMVATFGIALGANEEPSFLDDTFTSTDAESWNVGTNSNGYSNNFSNGTLLKDILQTTNTLAVNKRNAKAMVNGQAYITLDNGKIIKGPMVSYSLRNVLEGVGATSTQKALPGVDELWDNQKEPTQKGVINLYKTFESVMKAWTLPNIKAAVIASGEPTTEQMENIEAVKTASAGGAITAHPGGRITYTISVTNNNEETVGATVTDTLPAGTSLVSGCDTANGSNLTWRLNDIAPGETKNITYTVKPEYTVAQVRESDEDIIIENTSAKVWTKAVEAPAKDIYVLETFNATDIRRMEMAIDSLVTANPQGKLSGKTPLNRLGLLNMMYYVGFTSSTNFGTYDSDEILTLIYEGTGGSDSSGSSSDEEVADGSSNLQKRVVPTLYGGTTISEEKDSLFRGARATTVTIDDLITGDTIIVNKDSTTDLYVVDGQDLIKLDETEVTRQIDPATVLPNLPTSDKYVVIRPSINMNVNLSLNEGEYFNDADKEGYTDLEKALIATAETYLLRGDRTQYTDDRISTNPLYRWQKATLQPEDYTVDQYGYTNCAAFTHDVHWSTYGVVPQGNTSSTTNEALYTTAKLASSAAYGWNAETLTGGNASTIFYCRPMVQSGSTYVSNMTAEEQAEAKQYIIDSLRPGDIINIRRTAGSGHAMLYVGNGLIIHSTGSSYSEDLKTETHEASIRFRAVMDLFDASIAGDRSYVFNLVSFSIVRPQNNVTTPAVTANTANRIANMSGIIAEKVTSTAMGKTVNPGDEITYTFYVFNTNDTAKTVTIEDVLSEHVTFVSATNGGSVSGNNISWNVTVPADTRMSISYTVTVNDGVAAYTAIDGTKATVNGVSHKCVNTYVGNTLTTEQQQKVVDVVNNILENQDDYSSLSNVELAELIYKEAFGVEDLFGEQVTDYGMLLDGGNTQTGDSTNVAGTDNVGVFNDTWTYGNSSDYPSTVALMDMNTSKPAMMVAPGLYGGKLVTDSTYNKNSRDERFTRYTNVSGGPLRSRLMWEKDLVIGDIFLLKGSTNEQMFIYIGDDTFVSLGGVGYSAFKTATVTNRFQYAPHTHWKKFAVLRPSLVLEDI